MAACLIFSIWALVTSSFLACTDAIHSSHTSYSNYEDSSVGQHRGGPRRAQIEQSPDSYMYDISGKMAEGFQRADRFTSPGEDLEVKSWPVRGTVPRQHFVSSESDSGSTRTLTKEAQSSLYDDDEDDNELVDGGEDPQKNKRESHSLSIVNPLDVLRQRLMLEMARRRMKENQDQIRANDVILKSLGKRSVEGRPSEVGADEGRTGQTTKQEYLSRHQVSAPEDFEV